MKEYMQTLTDVKVALAEIKSDLKQISEMKTDMNEIAKCAREADNRSKKNEEGIKDIIANDRKKWGAILTVSVGFVLQIVYFLMTYHVK